MKKQISLAVAVAGVAAAAPALMTKTPMTSLSACKAIGCKQTKRYTASNDIMGTFTHVEYSTKQGYELQADYSLKGELVGAEITVRRHPLDESDKKVILQLIEDVTGSKYTKQTLEKCFAESASKATLGDFFSGQVGLASGTTPAKVPWHSGCWTFVKPYAVINRVYITFSYQ